MMHFISLPVSVNSGIATDKVANVTKHKVNKTSHVDTFPSAMMVVQQLQQYWQYCLIIFIKIDALLQEKLTKNVKNASRTQLRKVRKKSWIHAFIKIHIKSY